jgi:hypothetical protein
MAHQVIAAYDGTTDSSNIQLLARGTASPDVVTSGKAIAAADTFEIDVESNDNVIIAILGVAGTSAITFDAGDYPPSPQAGLGADVVSAPAADVVLYIPQAGRHIQSTGKITGSVATATCNMWVFRVTPVFDGVVLTNLRTIPAAPAAL